MTSELPRLPLPYERALMWVGEDWEVRLLTELLIAIFCIPLGMGVVAILREGAYAPDGFTVLVTAFSLMPLVVMASLRQPKSYLLTSHRIAEVHDGALVWSLRFEQISRIRRIGGTLHLRGPGKTSYSVQNLRHVFWLQHTLWERSTR